MHVQYIHVVIAWWVFFSKTCLDTLPYFPRAPIHKPTLKHRALFTYFPLAMCSLNRLAAYMYLIHPTLKDTLNYIHPRGGINFGDTTLASSSHKSTCIKNSD